MPRGDPAPRAAQRLVERGLGDRPPGLLAHRVVAVEALVFHDEAIDARGTDDLHQLRLASHGLVPVSASLTAAATAARIIAASAP